MTQRLCAFLTRRIGVRAARTIALCAALAFALALAASAQQPQPAPAKKGYQGKKAAPAQSPARVIVNKPKDPLKPEVSSGQLIDDATLAKRKTATLLVLHTNDIHDIIKSPTGPNALGGTPHLATFIREQRAARPDVLVLNAGDMLEKGDRVGIVSKGEVSFRALAATGVDCIVPGNHDFKYGGELFIKHTQLAGLTVICSNLLFEDTKQSVFKETFEKKVGDVRVGVIGACIPRTYSYNATRKIVGLDNEAAGDRVNELAIEMEPRVDLTILLLHSGLWAGRLMAGRAPMVDLVVCGHSNEVTEKPELTTNTRALVVEVGRAGQWVGSMDLTVDLEAKKIAKYTFGMVPMDHTKIKPDEALTRKIAEWEKEFMPEGEDKATSATQGGDEEEAEE